MTMQPIVGSKLARSVLSQAVGCGADLAELYLEDRVTTSLHLSCAHPRGEYQTQKRSLQWMLDAIESAHMDYNYAIQMHDKINETLGVA